MAKHVRNKLSPAFVKNINEPGKYGDGGGLWLIVDKAGGKRWRYIFSLDGKRREMGLGNITSLGLAKARIARDQAAALVRDEINPIHARQEKRRKERAAEYTFGKFTDELVPEIIKGFRNEKHRNQWKSTLEVYAKPIRNKQIDKICTEDILGILRPIWLTKAETASRVRGRIEHILDAAKAQGLRSGENPARWKGHLDNLLPKRQKLTRGHHSSMPFEELPAFYANLQQREAVAARALEFLILTASRSGEVYGAQWNEIDFGEKLWVIPPQRMKAGREHRIPLSDRAVAILDEMKKLKRNDFIFPGTKPGKPLSGMSMTMLLRRMKVEDVTVHGFRSTFRDWAGEKTNTPREIAETALAHMVGDATERAYRRRDALEKRAKLMVRWDHYCQSAYTAKSNVIELAS